MMKCRGMGAAKKGYAKGGELTMAEYDAKKKVDDRIEAERQKGIDKGFIKGVKSPPKKATPKKAKPLTTEQEYERDRPRYLKNKKSK